VLERDPQVSITGVRTQDGMGDGINLKSAPGHDVDPAAYTNQAAAINAQKGYFTQPDTRQEVAADREQGGVRATGLRKTVFNTEAGHGGGGQGARKSARLAAPGGGRPRARVPLWRGTFPERVAAAVARMGNHMRVQQTQREACAAKWVQCSQAAVWKPKPPTQFLVGLDQEHKALTDQTDPVTFLMPLFTRKLLAEMDKGLRGRGYPNVHGDWYRNGCDKNGKRVKRAAAAAISTRTQEFHSLRMDRRIMLNGAARGFPGLAIVLAYLEAAFPGDEVLSVDPHYQGA